MIYIMQSITFLQHLIRSIIFYKMDPRCEYPYYAEKLINRYSMIV